MNIAMKEKAEQKAISGSFKRWVTLFQDWKLCTNHHGEFKFFAK